MWYYYLTSEEHRAVDNCHALPPRLLARHNMDSTTANNSTAPDSAAFGNVRNDSATFRNIPKTAEDFRTVQKDSEGIGTMPKGAERGENHSLTVREVARMFEAAGVARTERSITNWCQQNRTGVARLDAYFDPNERRYYITPQSVEHAIAEENAKAAKAAPDVNTSRTNVPNAAEPFRTPADDVHDDHATFPSSEKESQTISTLEAEVMDLRITNRAKDYFIDQLKHERETFVEKLTGASHRIGELETKLLQIENPSHTARDGRPALEDRPTGAPPPSGL